MRHVRHPKRLVRQKSVPQQAAFGVRMALGASAREVLGMVLRQGALTSAIGVFFGIAGSLVLTHWIQSQLFGVSATDPATFFAVALLNAPGFPGRLLGPGAARCCG